MKSIRELLNKSIFKYTPTVWFNKVDDPEGDNSHPGTKFTAKRANNIEKGVEKAHERLNTMTEYINESDKETRSLQFEFLLLKSSIATGLTSNILVNDLETIDSFNIDAGMYDEVENKIYLP